MSGSSVSGRLLWPGAAGVFAACSPSGGASGAAAAAPASTSPAGSGSYAAPALSSYGAIWDRYFTGLYLC